MVKYALLARVEAKAGKEADVERFLKSALPLAQAEPATRAWYAWKIDAKTFGIFDTFETEDARNAHLGGAIPAALGQVGPDLLAADPSIQLVDVIAVK